MAVSDQESEIFSPSSLLSIESKAQETSLTQILSESTSKELIHRFVRHIEGAEAEQHQHESSPQSALTLGFAALSAFLQANVTGPTLDEPHKVEAVFLESAKATTIERFRVLCQRSLDTDGVSPYPHIPFIELFCLARFVFITSGILPSSKQLAWTRWRVSLWHYKLLTQPSLGPGSLYTKSGRWTDVATLEEAIQKNLAEAEEVIDSWPADSKVLFRLEEANCQILLGNDGKARQALQDATSISGFMYALSGAMGKRTRFQDKSYSQLVVLAKSLKLEEKEETKGAAPEILPLNDDTILEKIEFNDQEDSTTDSALPVELKDIKPDQQPELRPVDQIILLTEATIKDTFSPSDSLTLEQILPFAVRVIDDKAVNWQIYTQALLVRSRIELNRSRTVERGVLQMQAVADQVIVDTQEPAAPAVPQDESLDIPTIQITLNDEVPKPSTTNKPTSFLPAPKPSESASAKERLQYVNALASPPRWHLESELAYAWTSVGSLVSALEIFKRLRLWPEVALCLASTAADDENGRGAGAEEKARAIVRWRLFHRTNSTPSQEGEEEDVDDIDTLKPTDFYGAERSPPPPNAPRLFCILGDMENDAAHYLRAWEISNHRYARAQKSLGELHLQNKSWTAALEAYRLAVGVNRLSTELWNRLGDIELRLGHFPDAAEAFQRGIATANDAVGGEDARTWSNLGTAYLSWYREVVAEAKAGSADEMPSTARAAELGRTGAQLLQDSLGAFKRGATLANTNWRIWDNVITLAASLRPVPNWADVVLGVRSVLRIRRTEEAVDLGVLGMLVREVVSKDVSKEGGKEGEGVYDPPRGTIENSIVVLFEEDIVPLITGNSACWALVSRIRAWRRDFAGALDAAEKGWRTAVGGVGSALSATAASSSSQGASWLVDRGEWDVVVARTTELVAAYENLGPRVEGVGERWKGKARSAVRSVMGKAKEAWEGDGNWEVLGGMLEDLR